MRTVGIVVEYNPLHNGHLYHIQQSRKITGADAVVAVMSGHWLQRGEPAIADKWARAEMALRAGCDLVLELPVAYSSQPAQWFAYGAVAVLQATGIVDTLCFGSESGDLETLVRIASILSDEPEEVGAELGRLLKEGLPYPSAYAEAVRLHLRRTGRELDADFRLDQPNHTLGLHYLLALRQLGSPIVPYSIRRERSDYSQKSITDASIASATALRELLSRSGDLGELAPYVPPSTLDILRREAEAGRFPVTWESFSRPLFHLLAQMDESRLASFAEATEGLEFRLRRSLSELASDSVEELIARLKTKRYTRTKLQRLLLRVLLGHTKDELNAAALASGVRYVRVLGFTERGRQLLRRMKKAAAVPVIHSAAGDEWPYLRMDARAGAVYALAFRDNRLQDGRRDYSQPPIRI
ncbi:nucleotidyltransferase [Cohnella thailandensis]|uniref:tRNA(Met) cytidine acetate ligase n=1 Tax=Cohnella thailandensis TaxID=557557 RepID=A0A841T2N1_9BACL|nr:nucleotidyltransferase [Cohnella thailandensis]MBB6636628.1 nucleotidyltransferase [Cohnella thailandensis]MBP1973496.1 putative nucleotidyltransferase [Cohnella thailandensis]